MPEADAVLQFAAAAAAGWCWALSGLWTLSMAIAIKLKQVIYAHALRASSPFQLQLATWIRTIRTYATHTHTSSEPGSNQQLLYVTSESSTAPALALSYQHGMQFSKLSIFYANSHTFQDAALSSTAAAAAARLAPMHFAQLSSCTPRQGADRRRIKRLSAEKKQSIWGDS